MATDNDLERSAALPTLAKVRDLQSPEPLEGLSHWQMYLNLRAVARLGLDPQPAASQLGALAHP